MDEYKGVKITFKNGKTRTFKDGDKWEGNELSTSILHWEKITDEIIDKPTTRFFSKKITIPKPRPVVSYRPVYLATINTDAILMIEKIKAR